MLTARESLDYMAPTANPLMSPNRKLRVDMVNVPVNNWSTYGTKYLSANMETEWDVWGCFHIMELGSRWMGNIVMKPYADRKHQLNGIVITITIPYTNSNI